MMVPLDKNGSNHRQNPAIALPRLYYVRRDPTAHKLPGATRYCIQIPIFHRARDRFFCFNVIKSTS
jgi:hypothetical protein